LEQICFDYFSESYDPTSPQDFEKKIVFEGKEILIQFTCNTINEEGHSKKI
jgi:hypothetical protein